MGPLNDGSPADLRGLTTTEAKGGRITVWYEEAVLCKYTGVEKQVEVPYTGVVLGIHYQHGISVRFDNTVGADGKPERIHITNDDDWAWGKRQTKPATWTLGDPMAAIAAAVGKEQHVLAMLM